MPVIEFPIGGRDFDHGQYRRVSVESVEAYMRIAEGNDDLIKRLERALRIQSNGYCHLEEDVETAVFRLVGT